jgi:hypothetical protein
MKGDNMITWKKELRDILIDAYLDYRNDYLTIDKFAEHHGLYPNEAQTLINLGKGAWEHKHPEA